MAILNRFSAILLYCDSTHVCASRCGISGDFSAILGIVRFAVRDSVPLSCLEMLYQELVRHFGRRGCLTILGGGAPLNLNQLMSLVS